MRTVRISEAERLSLHDLLTRLLRDNAKTDFHLANGKNPIWIREVAINKGDLTNLQTLMGKVE